jgi:hypothetical protein
LVLAFGIHVGEKKKEKKEKCSRKKRLGEWACEMWLGVVVVGGIDSGSD